jgi:hypothetical protein
MCTVRWFYLTNVNWTVTKVGLLWASYSCQLQCLRWSGSLGYVAVMPTDSYPFLCSSLQMLLATSVPRSSVHSILSAQPWLRFVYSIVICSVCVTWCLALTLACLQQYPFSCVFRLQHHKSFLEVRGAILAWRHTVSLSSDKGTLHLSV